MKDRIKQMLEESSRAKEGLCKSELGNIEKAAKLVIEALKSGGKLIAFGNGGSAADSQHMAAELVGRFKKERRGLPAIALTANSSTITAVANDYSYDLTFSRQIEALGRKGDVALAISTSGNSKNVIEAVRMAQAAGIRTIGLLGGGGGKLKDMCDVAITAATKNTPRAQESHITVIHIICELVEDGIC